MKTIITPGMDKLSTGQKLADQLGSLFEGFTIIMMLLLAIGMGIHQPVFMLYVFAIMLGGQALGLVVYFGIYYAYGLGRS